MTYAPVTGAWRPGDPPGRRKFLSLFGSGQGHKSGLDLEAGGHLSEVTVAYETWGKLNAGASNAVLVLHALSGDSHVSGPVEPGHPSPGWWGPLVGPGAPIDTNRYFVVCPNVLGGCQGTTGPSSWAKDGRPYGSRFPVVTVKDQVVVERALTSELGIDTWYAVTGGSMGGMRALQWAVDFPDNIERAVVVATGAAASAEQIALCSLQNEVIRLDPDFRQGDYYDAGHGPIAGLSIARGIGHLSYRSEVDLQQRFANNAQDHEMPLSGGRFAVESYLDHQGEKLVCRFDANSYLVLSEAMNHYDLGRGYGGAREALSRVRAKVTVAGISSDRLYPLRLQWELVELLGSANEVRVIDSIVGHDAFLVEHQAMGNVITEALAS
ncbi:MAG: homoserine O-acetyltransferase [Acidimicrobiales bacterium]|jgi:homoserine O-acetyltransferase